MDDQHRHGRVVIVAITAEGRTAVEAFRAQFLAALKSDLEVLSDRELQALSRATETLGSFVDALQAADRGRAFIVPSSTAP
jgi:DNA-binding MarR family transcriptional regulator